MQEPTNRNFISYRFLHETESSIKRIFLEQNDILVNELKLLIARANRLESEFGRVFDLKLYYKVDGDLASNEPILEITNDYENIFKFSKIIVQRSPWRKQQTIEHTQKANEIQTKKIEKTLKPFPPEYICELCHQILTLPAVVRCVSKCGRTACRHCIDASLKATQRLCPFCHQQILSVVPNKILASILSKLNMDEFNLSFLKWDTAENDAKRLLEDIGEKTSTTIHLKQTIDYANQTVSGDAIKNCQVKEELTQGTIPNQDGSCDTDLSLKKSEVPFTPHSLVNFSTKNESTEALPLSSTNRVTPLETEQALHEHSSTELSFTELPLSKNSLTESTITEPSPSNNSYYYSDTIKSTITDASRMKGLQHSQLEIQGLGKSITHTPYIQSYERSGLSSLEKTSIQYSRSKDERRAKRTVSSHSLKSSSLDSSMLENATVKSQIFSANTSPFKSTAELHCLFTQLSKEDFYLLRLCQQQVKVLLKAEQKF